MKDEVIYDIGTLVTREGYLGQVIDRYLIENSDGKDYRYSVEWFNKQNEIAHGYNWQFVAMYREPIERYYAEQTNKSLNQDARDR